MKKLIYSLSALLVLFVSCYTLVSCTESHVDATVSYGHSEDRSDSSSEKYEGTVTGDDIGNAVITGMLNSGYETMSSTYVVLRNCTSESDAKSKAQSVADNAIKYLKTKYPNYKTDLKTNYNKFSFWIELSYDGKTTKIYEETVR